MRYMYLIYTSPETMAAPPPARLMEAVGKMAAMQTNMLSGGGLKTIDQAVRASLKGGKLTITDGPFAESKEVMGGYAIFEHATRAEAIESMRQFMELHVRYGEGWEGVCEMREMVDAPANHA